MSSLLKPRAAGANTHRSEPNVARLVEQQFQDGPYPVLRNVICEYDAGRLTLRGRVSTFYLSQIAQSLAAKVPGVDYVENCLEVT